MCLSRCDLHQIPISGDTNFGCKVKAKKLKSVCKFFGINGLLVFFSGNYFLYLKVWQLHLAISLLAG